MGTLRENREHEVGRMRIVVLGGTGHAGSAVVQEAVDRGLDVTVLSRSGPRPGAAHHERVTHVALDVLGEESAVVHALRQVLTGAGAVVDTSNGIRGRAQMVFVVGADRVARVAADVGVRRLVALSIVGCNRGDYSYYRRHEVQEQTYLKGKVPATVVRATQFHDFIELFTGRGGRFDRWTRLGVVPYPRGVRFQPIDVRDVAKALVDAAEEGGQASGTRTVAGPEVLDARDMARRWARARGARGPVVGVPLPGSLGAFFRAGWNLSPEDEYGTRTFDDWLAGR